MMQAFLPLLRKTGGRIVNISSISGRVAFPFAGPYVASKFALEAASDSLRRELRPWNIKVCLIEPGNIETPLWAKTANNSKETSGEFPEKAKEYYLPWMMSSRATRKFANDPSAVSAAVLKALSAATDNVGLFFGEDIFIAFGAVLLMQGFYAEHGIVLEPLHIALWGIPTAICAFLIHGWRLARLDRRLRREAGAIATRSGTGEPR